LFFSLLGLHLVSVGFEVMSTFPFLEIALNGVSAKIQPHGLLQPGRR